jgi:hypothetical protein
MFLFFLNRGHGIYLDQAASNIVAEGNIVHDTMHACAYQHFGSNNSFVNNIFALAFGGFGMVAQDAFQYDQFGPSNITFAHNILFLNSTIVAQQYGNPHSTPMFACPYHGQWASDYNLFWNTSTPSALSDTFISPAAIVAQGAAGTDYVCNTTFAAWQSTAPFNDQHSLVGDPGFFDVGQSALEARDFRLQDSSPAIQKLGFQSLNAVWETAGPVSTLR